MSMSFEKVFSPEEFTSLKITCSFVNMNITCGDNKEAHLVCSNVPDGSFAEIQEGVLVIEMKEKNLLDKLKQISVFDVWCRLELPEKMLESFTETAGAGNSTLEGISCAQAAIRSGAGNIVINGMTVKEGMQLETGAGNSDITDIKGGSLKTKTGAGNVSVAGELDSLAVKTGTGNMTFDGSVYGEVQVEGGIGNVTLTLHNKPEKVGTRTGIGKVDINYV